MKRFTTRNNALFLVIALLALPVTGAIAGGDHEGGHGHGEAGGHDDGHAHGHAQFEFGRPAPASEADRSIEIVARDDMSFEPESVRIERGQTVRFVVRNAGDLQHSFTLGDRRYHRRHDREMQDMPADEIAHHMQDSPNGMVIQPGKTDTLTWHFERAGDIRFACHIPGHYPAGMWGEIETSSDQVAALDQDSTEE